MAPIEAEAVQVFSGCGPDGLTTARLELRPLTAEDAAAIAPLIGDPAPARRSVPTPDPIPFADARDWIGSLLAPGGQAGRVALTMLRRADGALLGIVRLVWETGQRQAELGYWLAPSFRAQGYMTEAVTALLDYAFAELPLERIEAGVLADNDASIRLLERLGFAAAGAVTCEAPAGGTLDARRFSLARADWLARRARPLVLVAAAALIDADGRVLLARRPPGKAMAGMWEFPGGKLKPGETPEAALIRELAEELGIETRGACLAAIGCASHAYADFHLLMPLFACRRWLGTPVAREGQELAWVRPSRFGDYPMPPADAPLAALLRDLL